MKTAIHTALLLTALSVPCLALAWGCTTPPVAKPVVLSGLVN